MKTDISPQPPVPELWQVLDEASRECAPTVFPRERIVSRARIIRRRRRLAVIVLAVALLTPLAGELAFKTHATDAPAATRPTPPPALPSVFRETVDDRSPVRVVRPGDRVEAGLGVWYTLKKREYCTADPDEEDPVCVGPLDVDQPGAVPLTFNQHNRKGGLVHILAYTGETPAARITMTEDGRTTELPIVRLAGRPAFVSTYAVSSPRSANHSGALFDGLLFRVYDSDGKELAKLGDHAL